MKKKLISAFLASMLVLGLCACSGGRNETKLEGTLAEIAGKIYENAENFQVAVGDAAEIDLSNADSVKYMLGLDSADGIAEAVSSDAMITAVAYSMCLVRVQDGTDTDALKEKMLNGVDPRKWICVGAEKVITASCGDVILLVMGAADTADSVYNAFAAVSGGTASEPMELLTGEAE